MVSGFRAIDSASDDWLLAHLDQLGAKRKRDHVVDALKQDNGAVNS